MREALLCVGDGGGGEGAFGSSSSTGSGFNSAVSNSSRSGKDTSTCMVCLTFFYNKLLCNKDIYFVMKATCFGGAESPVIL